MNIKKFFLPLISLVSITSCNASYIKCQELSVDGYTYQTTQKTHHIALKCQAERQLEYSYYDEKLDCYYIFVIVSYKEDEKAPAIPNEILYGAKSGETVKPIKNIGKYQTYATVWYSVSQQMVKYENYYNRPVKTYYHSEIDKKDAYRIYDIDGPIVHKELGTRASPFYFRDESITFSVKGKTVKFSRCV